MKHILKIMKLLQVWIEDIIQNIVQDDNHND